jgi:hypothetical protein
LQGHGFAALAAVLAESARWRRWSVGVQQLNSVGDLGGELIVVATHAFTQEKAFDQGYKCRDQGPKEEQIEKTQARFPEVEMVGSKSAEKQG